MALVVILLRTGLNSLACAVIKQEVKIYSNCALWLKTMTGMNIMPIAEKNDNCVYTAIRLPSSNISHPSL